MASVLRDCRSFGTRAASAVSPCHRSDRNAAVPLAGRSRGLLAVQTGSRGLSGGHLAQHRSIPSGNDHGRPLRGAGHTFPLRWKRHPPRRVGRLLREPATGGVLSGAPTESQLSRSLRAARDAGGPIKPCECAQQKRQKPMEASGSRRWQHLRDATDSATDQSLEVEDERKRAKWQHWVIGPRDQRREGTKRGDAFSAVGEGKASKGGRQRGRQLLRQPSETWRTLWLAAGRNKPASWCAESRRSREKRHGRTELECWQCSSRRKSFGSTGR